MTAQIIDGAAVAQKIRGELKDEVIRLQQKGIQPGIAVIMVGDNPASQSYVKMKEKAAREIGMYSLMRLLPHSISREALFEEIKALNQNPAVHGILLQLPLTPGLKEREFLEIIDPAKDVDCFHPYNVGRLLIGEPGVKPCTPLGCLTLLDAYDLSLTGQKAVVVGRSNIVGKPVAAMLLERNATVTICHSRTRDLPAELKEADIVVAAVGIPQFITGDMLKPGAIVLDVGINRIADKKIVGDVDFASAQNVAAWITPVPKGVGPMTIAMLLQNTVQAAKEQAAKESGIGCTP